MVEILKRDESIPAAYPAVPSTMSAAAAALDAGMIWARIEAYIAHRWTARAVVWTVAGPGEWSPDLTPASVSATEIWQNDSWATETLTAGPLGGYVLDGAGPYRFTAWLARARFWQRLTRHSDGWRNTRLKPRISMAHPAIP